MGSDDHLPLDLDDRLRRGDSAAFEMLFRAYYEPLCSFATRYADSIAAAEELVQDVFARTWIDRARWPSPRNRKAYLFTAVRNGALNAGRRRQLETDWVESERLNADPPEMAEHATLRRQDPAMHAELDRAMTSLPQRCRAVMHLRWRDGMSYSDIADVLGISVKGVENQLSRGLRALRRAFGVDG